MTKGKNIGLGPQSTVHFMAMKATDLLIISPPAIRPTSPPLAPALLKAFLSKRLPEASCHCLDLNLSFYQLAFRELKTGGIKIRLYDWDHEESAGRVVRAADYLKNEIPSAERIDEFHHWSTIFLSFERIFSAFMADMAVKIASGEAVPQRIRGLIEALALKVIERSPGAVAFSILFDCQMELALAIASIVKSRLPETLVLFGGARFGVDPHPERLLEGPAGPKGPKGPSALRPHRFIDAVVAGEGEPALYHIMRGLISGSMEEIYSAPNLIYRSDGSIERNDPAPAPSLDGLPVPDFSDLSLDEYLVPEPVLPYMTARGCPWGRCSFCTHHHSYLKYRQRPVELVVEDLAALKRAYGCRRFNLLDEMIPPGRLRRLGRAIKAAGIDICYSAYAKPVKAFDQTVLCQAADSGCRLILWGVESASQRILDLMEKGTNAADMSVVLESARRCGIMNLVFVMFGFPGETEEEFLKTISFLEQHRQAVSALSKGTFVLLEGSRIYKNPERYGIKGLCPPISSGQGHDGLAIPAINYQVSSGLGPDEARRLYKRYLKRIEGIGLSPRLGAYRDHLLLLACSS